MPNLFIEARQALRSLVRTPVVTLSAVVCLALGLGVNGVMLGILDALFLWIPPGVEDPSEVHRLYFIQPGLARTSMDTTVTFPTYLELLESTDHFSNLIAFYERDLSVGRGKNARKVGSALVTANYFAALGVQPVRGRTFSTTEGQPEPPALVAVVSWTFWQRELSGASEALGQELVVGRDRYSIIGILEPGFRGIEADTEVDLWLPISSMARQVVAPGWHLDRGFYFFSLLGRLQTEVSIERAERDLTQAYRRLESSAPGREPSRVVLGPIQFAQGPGGSQEVRVALWLSAMALMVLLIAVANVANLLIVRGLHQRRELAVRMALGAGRRAIFRRVLMESALLAVLGGGLALVLGFFVSSLLHPLLLQGEGQAFSPRLLLGIGAMTVIVTFVCALIPTFWLRSAHLGAIIKGGAPAGSPGQARVRTALLTVQIALTLVLLIGAGLFLQSLRNATSLPLGFDVEEVLWIRMNLDQAGYPPEQVEDLYHRARARLESLPQVRSATVAVGVPFRSSFATSFSVPNKELPSLSTGGPYVNAVTEDFFATLGTRLLQGRVFTSLDRAGSPPVAIVNETMAQMVWPEEGALGQCVSIGRDSSACTTVVGVVEDSRRVALREKPTLQYYVPLDHAPPELDARQLFVRMADRGASLASLRGALQGLDADLPYIEIQPFTELLFPKIRPWRMGAILLSLFGLLALGLASLGLYGATAYSITRRAHEMGVRMALGADRGTVLALVLKQALLVAGLGIVLGLGLLVLLRPLVQPLLFEVATWDPWIVGGTALLLGAVALGASYVPGRRIRDLDPAVVLRAE